MSTESLRNIKSEIESQTVMFSKTVPPREKKGHNGRSKQDRERLDTYVSSPKQVWQSPRPLRLSHSPRPPTRSLHPMRQNPESSEDHVFIVPFSLLPSPFCCIC